jgi:hypothetical protein
MLVRLLDSRTRLQAKAGIFRRIPPYAQRYRWALALLLMVTTIDSIIMEVFSHVRQQPLGFSPCPDALADQPAGSDLVGVQQTVTSLLTQ